MSKTDKLGEVTGEMGRLQADIEQLFEQPLFKSVLLSRKNISQLTNKIYLLFEANNRQRQAEENKQILLRLVQSHLTNFLNNRLIFALIRTHEDQDFVDTLVAKWENFKTLVFLYYGLLLHAKDHYDIAALTLKSQAKPQDPTCPVLPVPAIAVLLFDRMVLNRFNSRIRKAVLLLMRNEREREAASDNRLRSVFEMVWSCSLRSLARIRSLKEVISFYKEERKQITAHFKEEYDNEVYVREYLLNEVVHATAMHYNQLYEGSLRLLNSHEQIEHITAYCEKEDQLAAYHFPTKSLISQYLQAVHNELILADVDYILQRPQGFRSLLKRYNHLSLDYLNEIKLYFKAINYVQNAIIDKVIRIVSEVVIQKGQQINGKINKSKEHISEMLGFKKSVRRVFEVVEMKTFKIEMAMEKCFKKLLDGLEVSKNLAEFTDYTIKECCRLKLDDEASQNKFKDILLLLNSISAKDSYLIHHQELLAKRLIEPLNEPKIEVQQLFLRMLAENLGHIMVASHSNMIKDIDLSNQFNENFSNKFPFISYRWTLKILNPTTWPDSCAKSKFTHIQPPIALQMHLDQLSVYYNKQYDYRSLKWKLERGTSLFEGRLAKGKYRFQAENIYMIILFHISEQPNHTILFGNLKTLVNDSKEEGENSHLQNYLKVLVQAKVIQRHPALTSEPFTAGEELVINLQYTPQEAVKAGQPIIIRPTPQMLKLFHQNTIEHSKIMKDREKSLQAALVKLLKHSHSTGNNSITFTELYRGIREHSYLGNFNFSEAAVKKRLQQLISKEYCERDEEDRRIYRYIA